MTRHKRCPTCTCSTVCAAPECAQAVSHGIHCGKHYQRAHQGKPITPIKPNLPRPRPCSVADCDLSVVAREYCWKHWRRWKTHGDPSVCLTAPRGVCSVDGCERLHRAHGYCGMHARRLRRTGTPADPVRQTPPPCSAPGCERESRACGLCDTHYSRQVKGLPLDAPLRRSGKVRTDARCYCGREVYAREMCRSHHAQLRMKADGH